MAFIKNQKVFTIIEVLLFLAISGLFFLIAFIGLGGRRANIQLTDSMRSLQAYLEKEMAAIRNGVNVSAKPQLGSDENFVFLGKMYRANGDTLESYIIYGDRLDTIGREDEAVDRLIVESDPQVDGATPAQTYDVRWGLNLRKSLSKGTANGREVGYFGFLLNPATNRLSIIIIEQGLASGNPVADLSNDAKYDADPAQPVGSQVLYDQELSLHLCYEDSRGKIAEVVAGAERLGPLFNTNFDNNVLAGCST
jgi:hypothetical protein